MDTYIDAYIEYKKTHINAWYIYEGVLRQFAKFINKSIEQITNGDVAEYQQKLMREGKPANAAFKSTILTGFFKWLEKRVRLSVFPFEIRKPRVPEEPCNYFTTQEMNAMEQVYREGPHKNLRNLVILMLLRDTGARISEINGLKLLSINQDRSADIMTRKALKMRTIFWTQETHHSLMKYVGGKIAMNQSPYLFEEHGKPICTRTIQRIVMNAAKHAKIGRNVTPHMYRHTKAFEIIREKGDIHKVQKVLGHSSMDSSLKYLRWNREVFLETMRK